MNLYSYEEARLLGYARGSLETVRQLCEAGYGDPYLLKTVNDRIEYLNAEMKKLYQPKESA